MNEIIYQPSTRVCFLKNAYMSPPPPSVRMSILCLASFSMKVKMTLVIREGGYIELGRINTVPFHLVSTKIARSENRDWMYFIIYCLIWTLGRHLVQRRALLPSSSIILSRWHVKEIALSLLILGYEVCCNNWWVNVGKKYAAPHRLWCSSLTVWLYRPAQGSDISKLWINIFDPHFLKVISDWSEPFLKDRNHQPDAQWPRLQVLGTTLN